MTLLLGAASGKPDGETLELAATLNRLELSSHRQSRYHKLQPEPAKRENLLLKLGGRSPPMRGYGRVFVT
jgi:hypothetical protein